MIISDLLTKAKKVNNYVLNATTAWDSTTNHVLTVPTGMRWYILPGSASRTASATMTVFMRDTADVTICALAEHAAGTGRGGYPSNSVAVGNSAVPSWGYILDAGEDLRFLFGAAQGAAAFIHAPVLEVKV